MKYVILLIMSCFISGTTLAQVIVSGAKMIISQGTTLNIDEDFNINGGEIRINQGVTFIMNNNRTLSVNNNGSLNLSGSVTSPVIISSPGYFNLDVNSGGVIGAQHAIFEHMGMTGLHIKEGATIDPLLPLQQSTFKNGIAGGTLLTINNNQVITIQDTYFPSNSWGGNYNVLKSADQGDVTFEDAIGGFAGTLFENDPFGRVSWGDELMTHSIRMPVGWNSLSSYIMPANSSISDIFSLISSNFIIAQTMSAAYYPTSSMNTIGTWESQSAYKVKMSAPHMIDISGEEESNKVFVMNAGWSLFPVITNRPVDVVSLFTGTSVRVVKEVAREGVYWPAYGINTLGSLLPGSAYYAFLNSPDSITFPANAKSGWTVQLHQINYTDHPWADFDLTGSSHLIAIEGQGINGLQPDDILGVFTQQDICFGATEIMDPNNNALLTAFANDTITSLKDGFDEMELLTYKVYRPSTYETFEIEVEYDLELPQTGYFAAEGLSAIKMLKVLDTGITSEGSLKINVYPNPTDDCVMISGFTDVSSIELINSTGMKINTFATEGQNEYKIDFSRLQPGLYLVLLCGNKTMVRRVIKK